MGCCWRPRAAATGPCACTARSCSSRPPRGWAGSSRTWVEPRLRCRVQPLNSRSAAMQIPHDSFVLVADGRKSLFFRNEGDGAFPNLVVEEKEVERNPAHGEQ